MGALTRKFLSLKGRLGGKGAARSAGTEAEAEADAPDLEALAQNWDALGEDDPLWAVLSHPDKRGGRWDPEEFFALGEYDIDMALKQIEDLPWSLNRGAALDFGCGVGRLTRALCLHFEHVDGVDIAPSMIEAAERLNRFPQRCRFHLNVAEDLALFPDDSFDLVYSTLVLQHIHPVFARRYVGEFVRLLADSGLAMFQIPTGRLPEPDVVNERLPKEAFVGGHTLMGEQPSQTLAGRYLLLEVRVQNQGPVTWPARGRRAVRLGARWLRGRDVIGDEAREDLVEDLDHGVAETLTLAIRAPDRPGAYTLELGLLQEEVAWFGDRGGPLTRADVEIIGRPGAEAAASERTPETAPETSPETSAETSARTMEDRPRMQMFVTPIDEVTRWVEDAGGRVVHVFDAEPEVGYRGAMFVVAGAKPLSGV
jgi:SAM-dependent methyltransferase